MTPFLISVLVFLVFGLVGGLAEIAKDATPPAFIFVALTIVLIVWGCVLLFGGSR